MSAALARTIQDRVALWHNRHPLAQRIAPHQVVHMGWVGLPFLSAEAPANTATKQATPSSQLTLRERLKAENQQTDEAPPAQPETSVPKPSVSGLQGLYTAAWWRRTGGAWRRAFSEPLVPRISARTLAVFGQRHGSKEPPSNSDWPVRQAVTDPALARSDEVDVLYLISAAIEAGGRRARLVISTHDQPRQLVVMGPRLWSKPRVALASFASLATVASASLVIALGHAERQAEGPAPLRLAHIEVAASAAVTASAPAIVAATEVHHEAPKPVLHRQAPEPAPPVAWPVNIRPRLDTASARTARQLSIDARALAGPRRAGADSSHTPDPTQFDASSATTFAVVARTTRTRIASEVMLGLMKTASASGRQIDQRTEVVAAADGWRASWWPFKNREQAKRALDALLAVGMEAELVEF